MTLWKLEASHLRTVIMSAVISALAAAPVGWMGASFEMGRTLSIDTVRIGELETDVKTLAAAEKQYPSREEFSAFQREELRHWSEQHDFMVRQDARTDEIIRDHAHILGMIDDAGKKKLTAVWHQKESEQ